MASRLSATSRVYRRWVKIEEIPDPSTPKDIEQTWKTLDGIGIEDEVDLYHSHTLLIEEGVGISFWGGPLYDTPVHILARRARERYGDRTLQPQAA